MCGRFSLATTMMDIMDYFGIEETVEFSSKDNGHHATHFNIVPRYNIAPSQDILVVRNDDTNHKELSIMRWGLIPKWQKEQDIGSKWINARSETVHEKPLFKYAFKHHRCLLVADGFYEWQQTKVKKPYYIHSKDGKPFGIAGLWERWESEEGKIIDSCTLLTTDANALMKPIHNRMPVILSKSQFSTWLDIENQNTENLQKLLHPYQDDNLESFPVSTFVNNPRNEGVDCVKRDEVG